MSRRHFLGTLIAAAIAVLSGCAATSLSTDISAVASKPSLERMPPIVFVHGDGNNAANWQTTIWRFESSGWPTDRLHAIEIPYPSARNKDDVPQAGRTSSAENMAYLKKEVEQVLKSTGASKVVLFANSRGGNAIRSYIDQGGGDKTVSHAILGGTPNHGVVAVKGVFEGNEFSGTGPFLTALNRPRNSAGDEVEGPVKWLTIRSDSNDKFAQPDGLWIGQKGKPTNITAAGPELKGAVNLVLPGIDHRETSYSPVAFEAAYRFITGEAPKNLQPVPTGVVSLNGTVTGMGVDSLDPKTGNFFNNMPISGAKVTVYATDAMTGARLGSPAHQKVVGLDSRWGPFDARPSQPYEFVIEANGYATTHIYRSGFPRSSEIVSLRADRIAEADKDAKSIVVLLRWRGFLDPARDKMSFDGISPPPGVPTGVSAGADRSKIKLTEAALRPIVGEFNGEKIVGQTWPASENHLVTLELTY